LLPIRRDWFVIIVGTSLLTVESPANQPTNEATNQPTNQPTNQQKVNYGLSFLKVN